MTDKILDFISEHPILVNIITIIIFLILCLICVLLIK